MLTDFHLIKSCFGEDDDPNDPEKFEIKNKRDYNPNYKTQGKKKKKVDSTQDTNYFTQSPAPNRKMSSDSKAQNPSHSIINSFLLADIKEIKNDFDIEYDYGNKEYKLKLCHVDNERIEGLATQMKFRLEEGGGECFYEIGVEDNGNPLGLPMNELEDSVETLKKIVEKLNATATVTSINKGKIGLIAEIMIKQNKETVKNDKLEVRIGLLGEEESGKSTLIGVLISNKLDNGKGLARYNVFRHKHEILCGKTSSISHQILGFDQNGDLTNYGKIEKPSWAQIVNNSAKILNFYDMGGTKKNFKKTMTAFSPHYLDYLLLVISAEKGITTTTEELLSYSVNMNLPIITIFTKVDLVSESTKAQLMRSLEDVIRNLQINSVPTFLETNDDIVQISRNIKEKNVIPVCMVSNVDWAGINMLKSFLSMLPVNEQVKGEENENVEFDIHETLTIGSKIIATGIVNKGKLISGNKCYIGPDIDGQFQIVEILNIQCKKIPVKSVYKGQYCSISLKSESKLNIRKGMVLLDYEKNPPAAVKTFEAEIWTIDGRKKIIKNKYQPVLNIKHIRQGCRILRKPKFSQKLDASNYCNNINREEIEKCNKECSYINEECKVNSYETCEGIPEEAFSIGSTQKTKLLFEFMFNPEYVTVGSHIIINDQLIKAYGTITKILN